MTISTPRRLAALTLGAAFALSACSSGATPSPSAASIEPSSAPATTEASASGSASGAVSGSINVSGSSTVEPISTAVAELFRQSNPDFNYTIEGPGTGDGFKRFCAGETDISDASRKIKDEEAATCQQNGIEYVELKIAIDGMTVMTAPQNSAVSCLSFPDLYALVGPESTGFAKWSDAQAIATELGSSTTFPDADLVITAPGEESGTYDSFVEIALAKIAEARGHKGETTRPDYQSSANDNVIIEGIAGNPTSFGWVGFAYAQENADKVKELEIAKDANGTCVAPTATSIADGSYPLSRSLYLYVNKAKAQANPAVVAYVDYYLADGTISTVLQTVPYVNLPAADLDTTRSAWEAAR